MKILKTFITIQQIRYFGSHNFLSFLMTTIVPLDGNTAASTMMFKLADIHFIYPITPSTGASEFVEIQQSKGNQNIYGKVPVVHQMDSETGSMAACHGASHAGKIPATYTSSQGLLLMLPNLVKMAGEGRPAVVTVASRSLAGKYLNIYGDQQDVQMLSKCGAIILNSANSQQCYNNALASFLIAKKLKLPVIHFYDGFTTSHELTGVKTLSDSEIKAIVEKFDVVFPQNYINLAPGQVGGVVDDDCGMQVIEAQVRYRSDNPWIIEQIYEFLREEIQGFSISPLIINNINEKTESVIFAMGAAADSLSDYCKDYEEVGVVQIVQMRPFQYEKVGNLLEKFPNIKKVAVLDKYRELGNPNYEGLHLDITASIARRREKGKIQQLNGIYGVCGKDFGVKEMAKLLENISNGVDSFALGVPQEHVENLPLISAKLDLKINQSLQNGKKSESKLRKPKIAEQNKNVGEQPLQIRLLGIGSEGTVSAAEAYVRSFGKDVGVQKMSHFDAKKSGGLAQVDLRIGQNVGKKHYFIDECDVLSVGNLQILDQYWEFALNSLGFGGFLVVNGKIDEVVLNNGLVEGLKTKGVKIYQFDEEKLRKEKGITLKERMNYQFVQAVDYVISTNQLTKCQSAISSGDYQIGKHKVALLETPGNYVNQVEIQKLKVNKLIDSKQFTEDISDPIAKIQSFCQRNLGNLLPVSAFEQEKQYDSNKVELQNSITKEIIDWDAEKCIQCGKCAAMCPHSCITGYLLEDKEHNDFNEIYKAGEHKENNQSFAGKNYLIQSNPNQCTGCSSCVVVCPTKALKLKPNDPQNHKHEESLFNLVKKAAQKPNYKDRLPKTAKPSEKGLQFSQMGIKGHGACAGCGEVNYLNILSKLHDQTSKQLNIIQSTGCPLVYLSSQGKQAQMENTYFTNSLFEDSSQVSLGLALADDSQIFWNVLGDGAAYDIGYAGLDFAINQNLRNLKFLILDTNGYSNTGGQRSQASLPGTSMKLATSGVKSYKNLVKIFASQRNCYIATIADSTSANRTMKILEEAEKYPGPALIIGYSPCISFKKSGGDIDYPTTNKQAVETGLFPLIKFDPRKPKGERFRVESPKTSKVDTIIERRITDYQALQTFIDDQWADYKAMEQWL